VRAVVRHIYSIFSVVRAGFSVQSPAARGPADRPDAALYKTSTAPAENTAIHRGPGRKEADRGIH